MHAFSCTAAQAVNGYQKWCLLVSRRRGRACPAQDRVELQMLTFEPGLKSSSRICCCFSVGTTTGPLKPRNEYWHPAAVLAILIAEGCGQIVLF